MSPSAPGQFPKKLSGQLQRGLTYSFDRKAVSLTFGTNLAGYPTFLQVGTKTMRPRPWLSLGWAAEQDNVARILTR